MAMGFLNGLVAGFTAERQRQSENQRADYALQLRKMEMDQQAKQFEQLLSLKQANADIEQQRLNHQLEYDRLNYDIAAKNADTRQADVQSLQAARSAEQATASRRLDFERQKETQRLRANAQNQLVKAKGSLEKLTSDLALAKSEGAPPEEIARLEQGVAAANQAHQGLQAIANLPDNTFSAMFGQDQAQQPAASEPALGTTLAGQESQAAAEGQAPSPDETGPPADQVGADQGAANDMGLGEQVPQGPAPISQVTPPARGLPPSGQAQSSLTNMAINANLTGQGVPPGAVRDLSANPSANPGAALGTTAAPTAAQVGQQGIQSVGGQPVPAGMNVTVFNNRAVAEAKAKLWGKHPEWNRVAVFSGDLTEDERKQAEDQNKLEEAKAKNAAANVDQLQTVLNNHGLNVLAEGRPERVKRAGIGAFLGGALIGPLRIGGSAGFSEKERASIDFLPGGAITPELGFKNDPAVTDKVASALQDWEAQRNQPLFDKNGNVVGHTPDVGPEPIHIEAARDLVERQAQYIKKLTGQEGNFDVLPFSSVLEPEVNLAGKLSVAGQSANQKLEPLATKGYDAPRVPEATYVQLPADQTIDRFDRALKKAQSDAGGILHALLPSGHAQTLAANYGQILTGELQRTLKPDRPDGSFSPAAQKAAKQALDTVQKSGLPMDIKSQLVQTLSPIAAGVKAMSPADLPFQGRTGNIVPPQPAPQSFADFIANQNPGPPPSFTQRMEMAGRGIEQSFQEASQKFANQPAGSPNTMQGAPPEQGSYAGDAARAFLGLIAKDQGEAKAMGGQKPAPKPAPPRPQPKPQPSPQQPQEQGPIGIANTALGSVQNAKNRTEAAEAAVTKIRTAWQDMSKDEQTTFRGTWAATKKKWEQLGVEVRVINGLESFLNPKEK